MTKTDIFRGPRFDLPNPSYDVLVRRALRRFVEKHQGDTDIDKFLAWVRGHAVDLGYMRYQEHRDVREDLSTEQSFFNDLEIALQVYKVGDRYLALANSSR